MSGHRFAVLDSWRGIAAVMVCLYHFPGNYHFSDMALLRSSYLFVDFFFVLSGFVIAFAYLDKLHNTLKFIDFAKLRFARLYPLHLVMLMLFVGYELAQMLLASMGSTLSTPPFSEDGRSVLAIITNVLFIHGLGMHDSVTWNGPSWSISTEFFTYLFFALVCVAALKLRQGLLLLAAIVSLGVLGTFSPDYMDATTDLGLFRNIFGFSLGALLFYAQQRMNAQKIISPLNGTMWEILCIMLMVAFVSYSGDKILGFLSPIIFVLVISVFSQASGLISRVLAHPFFLLLGKLSFAIYMVHRFIQIAIVPNVLKVIHAITDLPVYSSELSDSGQKLFGANPWQGDAIVLISFVMIFTAAWVLNRMIELPAYHWAQRKIRER